MKAAHHQLAACLCNNASCQSASGAMRKRMSRISTCVRLVILDPNVVDAPWLSRRNAGTTPTGSRSATAARRQLNDQVRVARDFALPVSVRGTTWNPNRAPTDLDD